MAFSRLAYLMPLALCAAAGCSDSRSTNATVDVAPAAGALELHSSSFAAFRASEERAVPRDSAGLEQLMIVVDGERLQLRKVNRPPPK